MQHTFTVYDCKVYVLSNACIERDALFEYFHSVEIYETTLVENVVIKLNRMKETTLVSYNFSCSLSLLQPPGVQGQIEDGLIVTAQFSLLIDGDVVCIQKYKNSQTAISVVCMNMAVIMPTSRLHVECCTHEDATRSRLDFLCGVRVCLFYL